MAARDLSHQSRIQAKSFEKSPRQTRDSLSRDDDAEKLSHITFIFLETIGLIPKTISSKTKNMSQIWKIF